MASLRVRKETGTLMLDFRYRGVRFREQTLLKDTPANRKRLNKVLKEIEAELTLGIFDYHHRFPGGVNAGLFDRICQGRNLNSPKFKQFANQWFGELRIQWRETHADTVRLNLDQCLIPHFGNLPVDQINKERILKFRTDFAKGKYSNRAKAPGAKRINKVMTTLSMILNEAANRLGFISPTTGIKTLKEFKKPVEPFTWEEIDRFLKKVRPDFRNYYTVRFLTGLRTGEIDGLRWRNINFERREILICEAIVNGKMVPPKTASSLRAVRMSEPVYNALRNQKQATRHLSEYVFCLTSGKPLRHGNVTKRVWKPTLRMLGLKERAPYETRHTAASLWMSAGENPEWIARQLGHANTQMLFQTYSRFIPNATRQDGSAFENVAKNSLN